MIIYKNCSAIRSGIMKPHTLLINNELRISIDYSNNLNQDGIKKYLKENGFRHVAIAYDKQKNKYRIVSNGSGILAIKNEYVKPLTVREMIKKYGLDITEEQYKQLFNIK